MEKKFIKNNFSIVVTFVAKFFAAGGIFSEFTALKDEINLVHDRLDEKIILIDRIQSRLLNIEKKLEYERGYIEARNNSKQK